MREKINPTKPFWYCALDGSDISDTLDTCEGCGAAVKNFEEVEVDDSKENRS
jgi:hypothetical protein